MNSDKLRAVFLSNRLEQPVETQKHSDDKTKGNLADILAHMRATAMHYQHAHWQTKGESSYSDHLMFERLYGSLSVAIDTLAEKLVGYYGPEALSPVDQTKEISSVMSKYCEDCFIKTSLKLEEALCDAIVAEFDRQEKAGTLKLGMNDFLASVCNERDTAKYLLKQRLA